ncbi:phospholipase D family protein [Colwellia psychrerythraea]|uniref:Phospholipase D-like domain containing protein n=1 Tax=Colwellia psychrerythraea TaxID=28229 RepID=A0A099L3G8_COLPS|nr:phospholipase D family protein [Colwellia psychrerythraea]KGJ97411.1 Phospholipase D-like domain containing protein [Colwellia psychrerythraea]
MSFSRIYSVIIYLFFTVILSACSMLPTDFEQIESKAYTDTGQTWLGETASQLQVENTEHSSMYLIAEGTDAFLTRMALLSKAERSVDVQYFIWKADIIGKLLMHKMLEVADKGVRVRLLLDDLSLDNKTKKILFAMDHHEFIEVRIYNPFSSSGYKAPAALTDTSRINRRMHNKSFTVDSQYTIVGGRNIEENYFSANERSNYADLDIIAVGPVVAEVNEQFDIYFNSPLAIPGYVFDDHKFQKNSLEEVKQALADYVLSVKNSDYAQDLKNSAMYQRIESGLAGNNKERIYQGKAHVIYDSPAKTLGKSELETTYMLSMLRPHVDKINQSLELISPYFVPGDEGTKHLIALVNKGIKVRVITNSLASTDGIMAQSGYARQRYELLQGGVELYELKPRAKSKASRSLSRSAEAKSALHAKTYIFDRKEVYIGSFNFDPRSAKINTELGVVCEIPEMAEYIATELFDKNIKQAAYQVTLQDDEVVWLDKVNGKVIVHDVQPETSWWRRFNLSLYSILPIESQL